MKKTSKFIFIGITTIVVFGFVWISMASPKQTYNTYNKYVEGKYDIDSHIVDELPIPDPPDSVSPYNVEQNDGNPHTNDGGVNIDLNNPPNYSLIESYNPNSNDYKFEYNYGNFSPYSPFYMSPDEYAEYKMQQSLDKYWQERISSSTNESTRLFANDQLNLKIPGFETIFGSDKVDIRPQGSAELIFAVNVSRRDDPALDVKQQRTANFDFDEKIQLNVIAKIGDKVEFGANYDTENNLTFDNKMNLKYEGGEDEIIKIIEGGDVTLPLNGTLITGSMGLFGLKTAMQFGKFTVTTIFSQQESESSNITVSGGAQTNEFEFEVDEYEENKHYFINHYFRDHYNTSLERLPLINSSINITQIEVWVTSVGSATQENRNIVAFTDLGESNPHNPMFTGGSGYPSNDVNNLTQIITPSSIRDLNTVSGTLSAMQLVNSEDYEKLENARKLSSNEYTFNSKLGFISLNSQLSSDKTLAVAYEYTVIGDPTIYKVGELSTSGISAPNCLIVKLLKSTALDVESPLWDLMMKNVYSIGGYQISEEDFILNVLYTEPDKGAPAGYYTKSNLKQIPLIRIMELDNLNTQLENISDGLFDFIDGAATNGGTINATNGRVYFPLVEPFGSDLLAKFDDPTLGETYIYQELYDLTKSGAQQYPEKNKYQIQGMYKSSQGSDISLNAMNVPEGSVNVTAGGIPLTENVDYTVDYTLGRVKIINEGILNSGTPINISLESQSMFIQSKTLIGTHVDYAHSSNLNLGATILNLTEKPLSTKVNYGDEPISNTIWGLDGTYNTESRLITRIIDFLPGIETKAVSRVSFTGEIANLIPGHSKAIGTEGISYIDDFEASKSSYDIKNFGRWSLCSTPQGATLGGSFPESYLPNDLEYGFNRARLAWYVIDPLFHTNSNLTPDHIANNPTLQYDHRMREVLETEVFPNKETPNGYPTNISVLNLAFYPSERGPYNYDVDAGSYSSGLNNDGTLANPKSRWGGIMRAVETTDFEATNVEYIEFWMMDPFVYDSNHSGGQLYINLGDISEDVLKDSRKSYENGLPTSTSITNVDTTVWGRVPNIQALVNTFDDNTQSRVLQDVGLDGLSDQDELSFFQAPYLDKISNSANLGTNSQAYRNAIDDPSADNYYYFRGTNYDNNQTSIIDRYKYYNDYEGNSLPAELSSESYPTMATNTPNIEDINRDNTLSESERYFQYRINLNPNSMNVGENYIADKFEATVNFTDGSSSQVTWYQFKVPVRSPDGVVGSISDYKSIRFMRMYMRGWSEEIILRFASLDLVRSDWRKYNYDLLSAGEYIPIDETGLTSFDISAVNIEENGSRYPIPYVLPSEIERERNFSSTNLQQLNEQSLVLQTCNLIDGDARAAYKNTEFDMRRYKNLQMFVHAEKMDDNDILEDGQLTLFIRLGSDFVDNYYEYEIPLELTEWGTSVTDVDGIWPESNKILFELDKLVTAKQNRNIAMRATGSVINLSSLYTEMDGANTITVVGVPTLSDVNTIMIGIRNPKKTSITDADDGQSKCIEVWVNELRLTDFDEQGGWAGNARMNVGLADLGNVILAGSFSTAGFGSIDQKINERQMENIVQYDIATNLELGKFFDEEAGIHLPLHFDYSEIISNPQYNPLDPDVLLSDELASYATKAEKDSIKEKVQDYTKRKNINFMNVRKNKTGSGKNHIYDFSNFDFTYAYSEIFTRNIDIQYNLQKTHRGAIGYNFSANPKPWRPLSKSKLFKSKYFKIIKDINFYYTPKLLSFRTDMLRDYNENLIRNKTDADIIIEPTFIKDFDWNRIYDIKYDLSQGMRFEYHATANARIDEPAGRIDNSDTDYGEKRDSIWNNVMDFGRITTFDQTVTANYNIPINKLPLLNFINSSVRYSADYHWTGSALSLAELGNTIENSNTLQLNANANMTTLYNKVPYLKKLNQNRNRPQKVENRNKLNEFQEQDSLGITTPKKDKINWGKEILDNSLNVLMLVKNVSASYTKSQGTVLPGFMPSPTAIGNDWSVNAPGLGFILGGQEDIRPIAIQKGWVSTDTALNSAYSNKLVENFNARATLEPFKQFRIEITAQRNYSEIHSEYYIADRYGDFESYSPTTTGSFSMSYIMWNTAFINDDEDNSNEVFQTFLDNTLTIAQRLADENPNWSGQNIDSTGYPDGYSQTSQDVLIPAFLAAYGGVSADNVLLNTFTKIPIPNWRITYTGLNKIKWLKGFIQSGTISHSYRSTYTVGGFSSNINYEEDLDGYQIAKDLADNYIAQNQIDQVTLSEQFAPLINIDVTLTNSFMIKVEFKKSRNIGLSFANNQLTEVKSNEYILGGGYRFKDVDVPIRSGGSRRVLTSDINIKVAFSIRDNKTVLRKIVENIEQVSAGQKVMSINASADYNINNRFTIRLFYDQILNTPHLSTPVNGNINAGISLKFSLAQ